MPELPEVETVVRDLRAAGLEGRTVRGAVVYWPGVTGGLPAAAFAAGLKGRTITGIERRGKYIVLRLSGSQDLLIHLRMTGQLSFAAAGSPRDKHQHVILRLDDRRELRYCDPRKFGRWLLLADVGSKLSALGPEPLAGTFTLRRFGRRLERRKGMLKPLLLNQSFVAGIGNIYADEALWEAGLHPSRRCETLDGAQRRRLYRAIRRVLRRGVAAAGTTLGRGSTNFYSVGGQRGRNQDGLKVFRRAGEPCPRCGEPIRRLIVAQRGTHVCPRCQK